MRELEFTGHKGVDLPNTTCPNILGPGALGVVWVAPVPKVWRGYASDCAWVHSWLRCVQLFTLPSLGQSKYRRHLHITLWVCLWPLIAKYCQAILCKFYFDCQVCQVWYVNSQVPKPTAPAGGLLLRVKACLSELTRKFTQLDSYSSLLLPRMESGLRSVPFRLSWLERFR